MKFILQYLTLLILGIYILALYFTNRLTLLIHERYVIFTALGGAILTVVAIFGLFNLYKSKPKLGNNFGDELFVSIIILLICFVPLKSLSSQSFNLRSSTNTVKLSEADKTNIESKIKFEIDTNKFSLYDWVKAKSINDNNLFKDKEFTAIGFISPAGNNRFTLSRFILSCCVVDATPVGVLVEYNYSSLYSANDWVEIQGKFTLKTINDKQEPVVIPTKITKVNQPENVYLNR
jgi:putative membrane protein